MVICIIMSMGREDGLLDACLSLPKEPENPDPGGQTEILEEKYHVTLKFVPNGKLMIFKCPNI